MASENDILLELKGIDGESKSVTAAMELSNVSFNTRISRDAYSGQARAKREHSGLTFVKQTDKATPLLLKALWENRKIDTGTLTFRKAGLTQQEYLKIELKEVYMASFTFSAAEESASPLPTETVQLVYRAIEVSYKEQTRLGTTGGALLAFDDLSKQE